MAQVIHGNLHGANRSKDNEFPPVLATESRATTEEPSSGPSHQSMRVAGGILLAALVVAIVAVGWMRMRGDHSVNSQSPATSQAVATVSTPAAPLSSTELKEMKDRDAYATRLAVALHRQLPQYHSVTIFADNWAGNHAPALKAPRSAAARTGDNLMLVFWSPTAGSARSLGDFTHSRAAGEAVTAGFAEFQFVDPDSYCFATVAPVTGVGPLTCGIR